MTFQAISRAHNLHAPRYMAGKQFRNGHGGHEYNFSKVFGPRNLEKIRDSPLQRYLHIAAY